jgi:hypothetical protein
MAKSIPRSPVSVQFVKIGQRPIILITDHQLPVTQFTEHRLTAHLNTNLQPLESD